MEIKEFRLLYPEYDDLTDHEIAEKLHAKFCPHINKADFYREFGVSFFEAVEQTTDHDILKLRESNNIQSTENNLISLLAYSDYLRSEMLRLLNVEIEINQTIFYSLNKDSSHAHTTH